MRGHSCFVCVFAQDDEQVKDLHVSANQHRVQITAAGHAKALDRDRGLALVQVQRHELQKVNRSTLADRDVSGVISNLVAQHNDRLLSAAEGRYQQESSHNQEPMMVPAPFIQSHLQDFAPSSANGDLHPELLVIGAGLLVRQMTELMTYDKAELMKPQTVADGEAEAIKHLGSKAESVARLGALFREHGSDKEFHGYHSLYASIFDGLVDSSAGAIATLEIGIGTNNTELVSTMGAGGRPGASNRAFRDYLPPNANVYAADIDPNILFQEERIKTALVDQLDRTSFDSMLSTLGESSFNLIVDDGLHSLPANLNVLLFGLKHVRKDGWVVIEDIQGAGPVEFWTSFVDRILRNNQAYRTLYVKLEHGDAYLVQKLE
eukprot:CAMPEP_0180421226 /NCGR_PEP_ID=MMETSP1036_2-20121128/3040_1 /TAXON_ID=632150 /ORGANISM="Azadinium spinosum, Strain 3D9" /LENGTH=376 /DNA_ID=CAMNT_0022426481 /DNA_START=55 /DNA_END=1185 /DNA_ORIENTATION=+